MKTSQGKAEQTEHNRAHGRFARAGWVILLWLGMGSASWAADSITVATYNVENYLLAATETRSAKPEVSRLRVQESLLAVRADVVALEEMGDTNSLADLVGGLKKKGLDYPHIEFVQGWDTNIHVVVLSRGPFAARRSHTNESFLLQGRRFQVSRGFAEVDIRVGAHYQFTLLAAHLKSRRSVADASESELREQEALILRRLVDERLRENPSANVIVVGDLNDTKDSKSTRTIIGRGGANALVDLRPEERNGDTEPNPVARFEPRHITWTHYYGKEDSYSRIDFMLVSAGMARELRREGTYVFAMPNWGTASDHRPVVAQFWAEDR